MNDFFRRTWAEIDLDAVAHNYHQIKDRLNPGTKVCCVIKADAYGHGAELLAREYEELGADWFAVSNLEEAIQLRNAQISLPILILGYTPPESAAELAGKIGGGFTEITEEPYYRYIPKNGLKLSTKVSMAVSDRFCMVKMICLNL